MNSIINCTLNIIIYLGIAYKSSCTVASVICSDNCKLNSVSSNLAPIVIDVERVAGANPRMDALCVEERTDVILAFCDTVTNAGYIPIVYYNTEMGGLYVDLEKLEGITKWYAWYGSWLYYPYDYSIWQYKDSGKVNGISGGVDMNIALEPFW